MAKTMMGNKTKDMDWNAISQLANSQEGKQLLNALAGRGGDALKKAAQNAAQGDKDAASSLIAGLLSTKEGADLAKKVMTLMNKTK